MPISMLKIGGRDYVVVPRKEFERMRRKAGLLSNQDATDVAESLRRLGDPKEKRVAWDKVRKRAGLA